MLTHVPATAYLPILIFVVAIVLALVALRARHSFTRCSGCLFALGLVLLSVHLIH